MLQKSVPIYCWKPGGERNQICYKIYLFSPKSPVHSSLVPRLASLNAHDSSAPFASCSSIFVSPSSLPLHLRMRVSLNVSTSWLSGSGIKAPLHAHSLFPGLFIQECWLTYERDHWRLRNLKEGTFPRPSPTFWFCPTIHFSSLGSDQLQELRTRKLGDSSRKRDISLIQLVTQKTPGK